MTPIEELSDRLLTHFSSIRCEMDPAQTPLGSWFLDIYDAGYRIVVEWQQDKGFGLTAGRESAYGEGADETFLDLGSVVQRLFWLLENRIPTVPAPSILEGLHTGTQG